MNTRLLISTSLIFIVFNLGAQDITDKVDILWGDRLYLELKNVIPEIVGYDDTGFYSLVQDYNWAIEHYDTALGQARREYLIMNYGFWTRQMEKLVHFHGVLYLFTSEERFNSSILYVQTIDKKTLKQIDEQVILEVPDLRGWKADFYITLSRLEQKLLVVSRTVIFGQKVQDIRFLVFGKNLKKEWESGDRIQHDKKIYYESEFLVDETGNAYMICLYFQPVLFQHFSSRKNSYIIVAFTDQGKSVNRYFADFPNKYIRGIGIEPTLDNNLACAGFYSPSLIDFTIDGLFFFTIDHEYDIINNMKFHELKPYFLEESMNLKPGQESKHLYNFYLDHLVLRKNGNFILTGEQVLEQRYDNHANIIVMALSPEGNVLWERVIQKLQNHDYDRYPEYTSNIEFDPYSNYTPYDESSANQNYTSYALFAPPHWNDVEILFNENLKNLNRPAEKKMLAFRSNSKAYLSCVEIGEYGEMGKNIIYFKNRRRNLTPAPIYFYDMKTNEMIIPALRYRKFRFMKLTFN